MQLLRCTQKLLKELAAAPVAEPVVYEGPLGSWFGHLFRIERRKCVLFTNAESLFSVFLPNVRRQDIRNLPAFFTDGLRSSLANEQVSPALAERLIGACDQLLLAKTNNRSVLGSMNDLRFQIEWLVHRQGGLERTNLPELNRKINRIPMSAIAPHSYAINKLRALVGESAT